MTTLSVAINASIEAKLIVGAGLSAAQSRIAKDISLAFSDGAGSGQANRIWAATRTLGASAAESLDVSGSMVDDFGNADVFARIKAILVFASEVNTNNVNVTRPASNGLPWLLAAGDGIALKPGAFILYADPGATGTVVTAATGDLVTFTNSAGSTSVTYTVIFIGASS